MSYEKKLIGLNNEFYVIDIFFRYHKNRIKKLLIKHILVCYPPKRRYTIKVPRIRNKIIDRTAVMISLLMPPSLFLG